MVLPSSETNVEEKLRRHIVVTAKTMELTERSAA